MNTTYFQAIKRELKDRKLQSPSKSTDKIKKKGNSLVDPFMIIREGDIDEIKSKIESGEVSLYQTRWSGFTLLHRAAEIGHTELCEYLINAGIPADTPSTRGWHTPLHIAMGNGYLETAQLIIDKGCSPWKRNKYQEDPFEYGTKRGFVQLCTEYKAKLLGMEMQKSIERHFGSSAVSSTGVSQSKAKNTPKESNSNVGMDSGSLDTHDLTISEVDQSDSDS
jgi:ankyrin repeat protein